MDDSQALPDNESQAATDAAVAEASAPTPPRPRGKHRLPPRRVMEAALAQPSPPAAETASSADVAPAADLDEAETAQPTEPTGKSEVSRDDPAGATEARAPEDSPAEPAAADPGAPPLARRWKWFRRRSSTASADPAEDAAPDAATEPVQEETVGTETTDETPLVQPKPAGKPLMVAVAAAAAAFVAAAAFAGAMLQPYLTDRALVNTKLDIARTAANAISTLWTYTPDDMDKLPDRSAKYLSGDFENQYRKYVDAIAPTNKQAQVTDSTEVMGAAVETIDGPNATAMVYTNTTYTSPVTKNIPSLRYLSYRLVMQRKGARWLITKMTTITSLDLTPRLGG